MDRDCFGQPSAYLGDGAYVCVPELGVVRVYTDRDGIRHWVDLGPHELSEFMRFCIEIGLKSKYLVDAKGGAK